MNAINPPKCSNFDYINFLIASSRVFSCIKASKCIFVDSISSPRLFYSVSSKALWEEVKNLFTPEVCFLIIDDTVLDKPYSKCMDLVYRQLSGKHHQIVIGSILKPFSGLIIML